MTSGSDSGESLERSRARIDRYLDETLPRSQAPPDNLHEAMRYAVLNGGKRLRPALAFAAAECAGADPDRALPVAAAVELVHAYSLVHDDLPAMDDDSMRRGRATVHVRYGEAIAVLVGDALLSEAFAQLASAPQTLACVARLAWASGSRALVGGQAEDIAFDPKTATAESITRIHEGKTAALFRFAVWGGAKAAGRSGEALSRMDQFGRSYGLAFQIADDLLDSDTDECSVLGVMDFASARKRADDLISDARHLVSDAGTRARALRGLLDVLEERVARATRR